MGVAVAVAVAVWQLLPQRKAGGMSLHNYVQEIAARKDALDVLSRFDRGALETMARTVCGREPPVGASQAALARIIVRCS